MILVLVALFLVSCSSPETLRVRQFHLREIDLPSGHPFIVAEMNHHLHGAVTERERKLRLGNYYHVRWGGLSGQEPVKIVFECRQAKTGASVHRYEFPMAAKRKGEREIVIGGYDYLKNGHVQAWRITLYEGKRAIAVKKSYLWD